MKREHQFGDDVTREKWERIVFEEADYFTCSVFYGRRVFQTTKHPNFLEAVKTALETMRPAMVYAVAASGRNVLIPRQEWVKLLAEFAKNNPDYEKPE